MAEEGREERHGAPGAEVRPERLLLALRQLPRALLDLLQEERSRWFLWWPPLFGAGIGFYFALPWEPGLPMALLAPFATAVLFLALPAHALARIVLAALTIAAAGFAAAKARTEWVRAPVLERPMASAEVRGVVELVEPRPGRGQRLTVRPIEISGLTPEKTPARIRVRVMSTTADIEPGDTVVLKATLKPPSPPSLPGDYDFARAAWYARLGAVGYARTPARVEQRAEASSRGGSPSAAIERLRQAIGARVQAVLPGETGAIATALITGERGGITNATNQAFRDSGLLHILSISGLHMVIMAGAVYAAVRLALAAIPAIALRFPIKKWAAGVALVAAFAYLLISGASVATVRSWFMTSIMLVAILLDRPALALRNVALAALGILAVSPESLHDAGFQMSFAAVVALIGAHEFIAPAIAAREPEGRGAARKVLHFFLGIVLSTLAASAAVAPFAAYHFHRSQQYAVLANVIAIPICNFIVMPASLVALVAMPLGLETVPLKGMGWGVEAMNATATGVAALPGAVGHIPAVPATALVLMVLGGLWLILWRTRWRFAGALLLAAGAALAPFGERPDLIAGREGELVAIRNTEGELALIAGPGSRFDAERWLEHDGDARTVKEATAAKGFACDAVGCVATLGGSEVAVSRRPAAVRDDCRAAGILILSVPRPEWCRGPERVIDVFDFMREGTHVFYRRPGGFDVGTVNGRRGTRPWVVRWQPRERTRATGEAQRTGPAGDDEAATQGQPATDAEPTADEEDRAAP